MRAWGTERQNILVLFFVGSTLSVKAVIKKVLLSPMNPSLDGMRNPDAAKRKNRDPAVRAFWSALRRVRMNLKISVVNALFDQCCRLVRKLS